ncbi:uncharacterized protein [Pyrus communis]|uniref:uncharacterized protein isoform X1 n=1 Tax=Pyrus communis TaxID=23211 RepID=UPI0035C05BE3
METMSVNTGNSHSNKRQASEHSETTNEEKRPAVKEVSTPVFVNHAAIAWHERRKKWVGNQRVQRAEKDPIISWSTSYEDLLSTDESFPEPIPLTLINHTRLDSGKRCDEPKQYPFPVS